MTVRELIKKLEDYPPNMEILFSNSYCTKKLQKPLITEYYYNERNEQALCQDEFYFLDDEEQAEYEYCLLIHED